MSNLIDISKRITNELPVVKITDDVIATVNNRKSNILNMQIMIMEAEKKAKKNGEEYDEMAFMSKTLEMLTNAKTAQSIEELDLPLPEYKLVYKAIMSAATGSEMKEDDEKERFQ